MSKTLGFIGVGNMGRCIIEGLLQDKTQFNILLYDHHQDKLHDLIKHANVHLAADNISLVDESDIVILAVKPQSIADTLLELKGFKKARMPVFLSVAAGIKLEQLKEILGLEVNYPLVRMMPNTPSKLQLGVSGLFGQNLNQEDKTIVETIANAIGKCVWVDTEDQMDIVTALSGSGPAYFFYFCEQLIESAVQEGLNRDTATTLCLQTALGAASMAISSQDSLTQLRKKVTSPGGTTEAGIAALESNQLAKITRQVIHDATQRGKELSNKLNSG